MLHGKADEDDISSSIAGRASARSTSCGFCTTQWTSAGMFRMIRRLADRSQDVERLIYWFDTHLTPMTRLSPNLGDAHAVSGAARNPTNEFKTAPGDWLCHVSSNSALAHETCRKTRSEMALIR